LFRLTAVRVLLGLAAVFLFYLLGVAVRQLYGSCVDIQNSSTETVRNVSVRVESGGRTYQVPNLAPGERRRVYVRPRAKSQVTLTITDGRNRPRDVTVFGGAQPGDCGLSMVTIERGLGHNTVSEEFHHPLCWKGWLDFI
jgi:hypothetical protein